ncbi:MAG TPA: sugar ABC transporter substrate-binding protein [Chloroflexota bacterium]|nr:sugar ABC transporter substrate-binding protein [Chloroflexota bacterium]
MKRRALLIAQLPTIVVAACVPGEGGSGGAKPTTALKTDVTVPFLQTSGQAEQGMVNQVVEKWKAEHPRGPQAEFVISTGDVVEKFTTMLAGGTPPALVSMDSTQGVRFSDQGEMVALDDFIKRDKYDIADYIPVSLDQYRWKGKLFALLRDFSHQALWVNTDMFAREGLTVPTVDYSTTTGGWTFDQFVETARRLTKSDGGTRATQYGYFVTTALVGGYGQYAWANGAELFDKDHKKCLADDERVVEGLQTMLDMRFKHRVAPDPAALQQMQQTGINTGAQQLFFENHVAMAIFPVARIGEARTQAKGKWDLAVTPHGKGRRLTTGGGVGWYQPKSFPHQEEAWAVMQHLTSAQTHLFLADVRIPGRKSVLDTWLAQSPSEPPKNRNVAKTGQQSLHIRPTFPLWDRIEREVFTPLLAPLWNNQATPRDVTREITAQANRILAGS